MIQDIDQQSHDSSSSFLDVEPIRMGSCPKCHCEDTKALDDNINWLMFKCRHCGFVFAQRRAFPYSYLNVRTIERKVLTDLLKDNSLCFALLGIFAASVVLVYVLASLL
jgi:ribosomal protein L37AE/L43A